MIGRRLFGFRTIVRRGVSRQPVPDQEPHAMLVGLRGVAADLAAKMRHTRAARSIQMSIDVMSDDTL